MSAELFGGPVLAPLTAKSLQELLGARAAKLQNFSHVALRADDGNAAKVWFGASDLTAIANQLGYLLAGEPLTIRLEAAMHLEKFFLVGNGTDVVYIAGVSY